MLENTNKKTSKLSKEQVERIAANCGVEVSYAEARKGGFIIDSSGKIHESVNNMLFK